ncbi:ABC transporter permease subunit [bacterium]|nr:ABC transporter permease subunit [bacterium]
MNKRIIAVAHNAFRYYLFTPTSLAIIIMLLLVPFLCSNLLGDGTAEGKFKVFVTYSFIISSIIFTVVNISFSCSSISGEWKKKTLLTLDVKPIRRWEIILGKWFGMLAINIVLVACFLLSMTFSSMLVSHNLTKSFPGHKNIFMTETELFPAQADELSQGKFLMSFLQMRQNNRKEIYPVLAKGEMVWTFKGIRKTLAGRDLPGKSDNLSLSYRFQTAGPEKQNVLGYWLVGNPSLPAPFESETSQPKDTVHRLPIPLEAVSDKGELNVVYLNIEPTNLSVLFPASDFKLLYTQGSYWMNLIKGSFNILILVTFIFSVGLCFSCIVSHLTAVLSTSILIFMSYLHEFIEIMLNSIFRDAQAQQTIGMINHLSYLALKFISFVLPPLNEVLPHSYIGNFLLMPFSYLVFLFIRIILLGVLPLLVVAIIYLSHKELGIPNE